MGWFAGRQAENDLVAVTVNYIFVFKRHVPSLL
uniref:Uncharacterized protein n=1 Tax=Anguilla anguilla TaxID=7936 RepID=A0A0E9TNP1_ANGAN